MNWRGAVLGTAVVIILAIVATTVSAYNNGLRPLASVAGPRLSLLDVADLKDKTLKRLTLKDVKDRGVRALGLVDLKDKRLGKVTLYDLKDGYRERLPLTLLREDALSSLTMSDIKQNNWLNTPAALPIPNNKVASARTSTQQALPSTASGPAQVALLPAVKPMQLRELPLPPGKQLLSERTQNQKAIAKPAPKQAKRWSPPRRYIASQPAQRYSAPQRRYVAVERSTVFPSRAPNIAVERSMPKVAPDYRSQRRIQREYARVYKREVKAYKQNQKAYKKSLKARMKSLINRIF